MKKGFTLIEIIVSVGILALVSIMIVQVLFTTTHSNTKTLAVSDEKQNGDFATDIFNRMVRSAQLVQTSCPNGATSAPSAQITGFDNAVTTLECLSDGVAARVASVSASTGAIVYLTSPTVTLSSSGGATCSDSTLSFSCPPASGIQNSVTMSFTLVRLGITGNAYQNNSVSFRSTVDVRNW